jgi:transcription antitermination factor NusA-like protein
MRAESKITIHNLIDELEDARLVAKSEKSASLMIKATMSKAELLGFVNDEQKDEQFDVVSDDKLAEIFAKRRNGTKKS